MASYKIELNSKPVKNTNEHKLMLRITVNKRHARIILPYSVTEKQFNNNPKNNLYVRQSCSNHAKINRVIDKKIQEAKNTVEELEKEGKLEIPFKVVLRQIWGCVILIEIKSLFPAIDRSWPYHTFAV